MRLRACAAALLILGPATEAWGMGFLFGPDASPSEVRVAVSAATADDGAATRVAWLSLRFAAASGPVLLIVPAPKGTALDLATPAFFQALEDASAVRVVPPPGVDISCPSAGDADRFTLEGDAGSPPLASFQELQEMATAAELAAWIAASGLTVPSDFEARAAAYPPGTRWVALRFEAPGAASVTPTLRLRFPPTTEPFLLPLSFTESRNDPLRVVFFGAGTGIARTSLAPVGVTPSDLVFFPAGPRSTYEQARREAIVGNTSGLLESASHDALAKSSPFLDGSGRLPGFAEGYFARAEARGETSESAATCAARVAQTIDLSSAVATACPRASLGVVAGTADCTETVAPGAIDPSVARCGRDADDVALLLSGGVPANAWLTRTVGIIPPLSRGADVAITFDTDVAATSPVVAAGQVDFEDCGTSTSASSTAGGGPGDPVSVGGGVTSGGTVIVDDDDGFDPTFVAEGCVCDPTIVAVASESGETGEAYDGDDGCSGDASDSYADDGCSGDASDTSSADGCDPGADYETSDSGCDSGGDSGGEIDCTGDSGGGDSCSGGEGEDCRIAARKGRRPVKLSQIVFVAGAVVLASRRLSRRRRKSVRPS